MIDFRYEERGCENDHTSFRALGCLFLFPNKTCFVLVLCNFIIQTLFRDNGLLRSTISPFMDHQIISSQKTHCCSSKGMYIGLLDDQGNPWKVSPESCVSRGVYEGVTLPETCLKLTASLHLKISGWKMKCPFGIAYFQGLCYFQGG